MENSHHIQMWIQGPITKSLRLKRNQIAEKKDLGNRSDILCLLFLHILFSRIFQKKKISLNQKIRIAEKNREIEL